MLHRICIRLWFIMTQWWPHLSLEQGVHPSGWDAPRGTYPFPLPRLSSFLITYFPSPFFGSGPTQNDVLSAPRQLLITLSPPIDLRYHSHYHLRATASEPRSVRRG
jgi:hypothetical protein